MPRRVTIAQLEQQLANERSRTAKAQEHAEKMRRAVSNILAQAEERVGTNSELGQLFFPALRDYCKEVLGTGDNGSLVRSKDRWGIDFEKNPYDRRPTWGRH